MRPMISRLHDACALLSSEKLLLPCMDYYTLVPSSSLLDVKTTNLWAQSLILEVFKNKCTCIYMSIFVSMFVL